VPGPNYTTGPNDTIAQDGQHLAIDTLATTMKQEFFFFLIEFNEMTFPTSTNTNT
jgi:hypothetical protein